MNTQHVKFSSEPRSANLFLNVNFTDEDIIERIDYILQNGGNAVGVQRPVEEIIPEIESLLRELKEKVEQDKEKNEDDSSH
ncbi:hypothetical protein [Vibrio diabolicus]